MARATMSTAEAPRLSMAVVLGQLARLSKAALQLRYREVFGHRPKSDNEHHLRTALAKALTASAGPVPAPKQKPASPTRVEPRRDPRLPSPGSVLTATFRDRAHEVTVLERGFLYAGQPYRSLSGIAKAITGTAWNGFVFFGLAKGGEAS